MFRRAGNYIVEALESYVSFWLFVMALCAPLNAGYYLLGWVGAVLGVLVFVVGLLCVFVLKNAAEYRQYIARLAAQRQGENLQTFRLALADPTLDSRVVEAVYNHFQKHLAFPLRPTDQLEKIGLAWRVGYEEYADGAEDGESWVATEESEEAEDELALAAGRSIDHIIDNRYVGQLATPEAIIRFLCAQPPLTDQQTGRAT